MRHKTITFLMACCAHVHGCSDNSVSDWVPEETTTECKPLDGPGWQVFIKDCGRFSYRAVAKEPLATSIEYEMCNTCPDSREFRWISPWACENDPAPAEIGWEIQVVDDFRALHPLAPRFSEVGPDGRTKRLSCVLIQDSPSYEDPLFSGPPSCESSHSVSPGESIAGIISYPDRWLPEDAAQTEVEFPRLFSSVSAEFTTVSNEQYCEEGQQRRLFGHHALNDVQGPEGVVRFETDQLAMPEEARN
jgi:hypothetical protein